MSAPTHRASETIAPYAVSAGARAVKLFRNGANQAVRIPKEFELPGNEAFIHREGDKLIIEPIKGKARTLAEAMKDWEDIDEPFPDVDEDVRAHLERVGTSISPNNTLIAAHALALDCTLVTDNETEFRRVPGLKVENWLRIDS